MWPFKKSIEDNTQFINLGRRIYPLVCDESLYAKYLTHIRNTFMHWFSAEVMLANDTNQDIEHHLIMQLRWINIKMLAHDTARGMLDRLLTDTVVNKSGDRFIDTILYISMTTPQEVIDTITGRFLFSVLYYIPRTIDDLRTPTKEEWLSLLIDHKWIPLLPLYQSIFDEDDIMTKLTKLVNISKQRNTTIAQTRQIPG